jgi:LytS/YehU family sensor histidine kinase
VDESPGHENILIPPMVLLTILQDSVIMLKETDASECAVNINIHLENEELVVRVLFDDLTSYDFFQLDWIDVLNNCNRRLATIYGKDAKRVLLFKNSESKSVEFVIYLKNILNSEADEKNINRKGGAYEPA